MKFTARARKIKGFDGILKLTQQRYPLRSTSRVSTHRKEADERANIQSANN